VFFYIGDIIDFSKVDLVGSGYFFCIYCIDNIVLCSFFFEVEIKLFFKYFVWFRIRVGIEFFSLYYVLI